MRGRAAAGFADAHADTRQSQLPKSHAKVRQGGHATPDGNGNSYQVTAVDAISELGDRHAERYIEQREGRAGEQSQYGIADLKLSRIAGSRIDRICRSTKLNM